MKRDTNEVSSFDLFLDTICNTFGGIVFLAILLALMIQTRAVVKMEYASSEQPPTPDEIRQLTSRLDSLASAHASLAATLENTPETFGVADDQEYRQKIELLNQLNAEIAEVTQQNAKASRLLAEQLVENAALQAANEKLPDELAETRKELVKRQTQYLVAMESKQQTLRLPKTRSSSAASMLLLFKGNRVYVAHRPSLFRGGFNADHVTTKTLILGGTEIRPVAGAGWPIDDAEGLRQIHQIVQEAADQGLILTTAVWPDSYARFSGLREKMIKATVPYQLWLQDEDSVLTVVPGSGSSRIQ